jgi:predicted P-loop ATPase
MLFGDPENLEFYALMFRKWFVCMVALWIKKVKENPMMPVLYGPQHIGKTFFVRHILPRQLASYLNEVNPSAKVDKDFEISLAETPLMFLDEFSVNSLQKSEAYKYAITSSSSYRRDSYGHFREMRDRKATLIAATNHDTFIMEAEGNRRYLAVNLLDTVNLNDHPLPYEGAYAQVLWLLENGFDPKPTREESELISEHNLPYLMPNDCEEALRTFIRMPTPIDNTEAYSAGDLLRELNQRGFSARGFKAVAIGRAMKKMGFDSRKINGTYKYNVVLADYDRQKRERIEDAIDESEKPF